jgi:hypothetical protein
MEIIQKISPPVLDFLAERGYVSPVEQGTSKTRTQGPDVRARQQDPSDVMHGRGAGEDEADAGSGLHLGNR